MAKCTPPTSEPYVSAREGCVNTVTTSAGGKQVKRASNRAQLGAEQTVAYQCQICYCLLL